MKHMLLALASLTIVFIMTSNSVAVNSFYCSHLVLLPVAQLDTNTTRTNGVNCAKTIIHLAVSPDSSFLATSDDISTSIELWDMNTYKIIETIPVLGEHVTDITFSPDSKLLAWASSVGGIGIPYGNGSIELYDLSTNAIKATLNDVADVVTELNMFDTNTTISFLGSRYGYLRATVQVWDTATQTIISKKIAVDIAPAFSTHAPNAFLGTTSSDADYYSFQIEQWDGQNDIMLRQAEVKYAILALAVNRDGSMLAAGDDKGIISFWDTSTLTTSLHFESGDASVEYLAFIGNDQLLSFGQDENQQNIRIWDIDSQPEMFAQKSFTEDMIGRFVVEPNQQVLALANEKDSPFGINLWNYETDVASLVELDC